ncbi:MAG TPA: SusC/RagA family TonB-linked outer membrane protein [Ferruginibacter sp.]|nr:SusC/RagA family TonB-linked outer membrane protein [Ferruginibacter sp.]
MRRFLSLFTMLMLCGVLAFAQSRVVSGTVTDANGKPIPFASVIVRGTNTGVTSDAYGNFSIRVSPGAVLQISQGSYNPVEVTVGTLTFVSTSLTLKDNTIPEVIVTSAFNIKRTARSTASNAQVIGSEQLNTIRATNLNNALAGKISGIQVRSQSSAKLGSAGNIRLRGESAFGSGSSVIYVVDGTILPNSNDVNMDDIEDVTVLQGPNAAVLFGPEGANGAVVITTKRANKNQKGIGIDINLGVRFDNVYIMPNYQNDYAGGDGADLVKYNWKAGDPEAWKALNGKYYHDYQEDVSWGPKIAGQEYIPWYSWYGGHERSYTTAKLERHPNNAKEFFNTAQTSNNNIAFSKATDAFQFRASYGNVDVKGLIPTSYLKRHTLNLKANYNLTTRLNVGVNFNYFVQDVNGDFDDAYSNQSSGSFNQWFHRHVDMGIVKELRGLRTPEGWMASWNHGNPASFDAANPRAFYAGYYWLNHFSHMDQTSNLARNDRLYGDANLTYKFTSDFSVTGTYRKQQNTTFSESITSSSIQESQTVSPQTAFYGSANTFSNRENFQLIGNYNKKVKDFNFTVLGGLDIFHQVTKSNSGATAGGLNVPGLYTIANSKNNPTIGNARTNERRRAIFGDATIGFRNNMISLTGTIRKDWFSTLPANDNEILSKSVGLAFVFSDLTKNALPFLSYGKLRGSFGEVPQSIGPYLYPGFAYGVGADQWNGNFLMSTPDQFVNPAIHGAVSKQYEGGIDLRFFKNRLGFSVTYYEAVSKDFPTAAPFASTSGFSSQLTNLGEIRKKGVDVQFNARPFWSSKFKWEINATWAYLLKNTVIDIDGVDSVHAAQFIDRVWTGASGRVSPGLYHEEGKEWGAIVGKGIKRINGQPVLDVDGFYEQVDSVYYGNILPKYTGGIQNSFEFHNFTLNANIDYQVGGTYVSLSESFGSSSGLTARTAAINDRGFSVRDAVADGGGIHVIGVDNSGKPVDRYVEAREYYNTMYARDQYEEFIYDLSFVKLRELSIGYNIPVTKIGNFGKYFTRANFSVVAINPVLIWSKSPDFDASEISDLAGEKGGLPGTRGIGFNLKLGF